MSESGVTVYYGERGCEGTINKTGLPCQNRAYFLCGKKLLLCGMHSKNISDKNRLPNNPNRDLFRSQQLESMFTEIDLIAQQNRDIGKRGHVIVCKMLMMRNPPYIKGYLNIFPNFKHQGRKDGIGCSRLSPKSLGPVIHGMPNLPIAKNLENFHQFSKFWEFELDDNNQVKDYYLERRKIAYNNQIPFRHKYDRKYLLSMNQNNTTPKFSVYYDKDGNERRYNYLQCRYFYCHFYERLVKEEDDYKRLKNKIDDGYNLQIVGYDGYPITTDLYRHYLDTSKPFGHELVLYTMLTEENRMNYPWNVYYNLNVEIYRDVITNDDYNCTNIKKRKYVE